MFETIVSRDRIKQTTQVHESSRERTITDRDLIRETNPSVRSSTSPHQGNYEGDCEIRSPDASQGGGFIVEDGAVEDDFLQGTGGGFIVEDAPMAGGSDGARGLSTQPAGSGAETGTNYDRRRPSSNLSNPSLRSFEVPNKMPTRMVPEALKMLNLPYKNSEILDIFETAASDPEQESAPVESFRARPKMKEKFISRLKFSKVCAVLMMTNTSRDGSGNGEDDESDRNSKTPEKIDEDDDYHLNHDSSDQESSASDYQPCHASTRSSTRYQAQKSTKTVKSTANLSGCEPVSTDLFESPRDTPKLRRIKGKKPQHSQVTSQDEEDQGDDEDESGANGTAQTFALFFQSTNSSTEKSDINNRTIGFAEVRRAADELGETLSDAEIREMLDYASYTNDSLVTFHAFQKLVREIGTV